MRQGRFLIVRGRMAAALLGLVGLCVGCTGTGSNTFALFPEGHDLLPAARALRTWVPMPPPLPRELNKTVAQPFIVQPGDVLLVEPVSFESPLRLPADQPVMVDGTIDLGQYGRPIVAGKAVEEIEVMVRAMIEAVEGKPSPINVRLIQTPSAVFYVVGEVNAPGSYPLIGRETVLDAVMAAGGLTEQADHYEIIVSRPTPPEGCRIVLPVCWDQIVQLGDTTTNYQLMPGDRVFVASRCCLDGLLPTWLTGRKKGCGLCTMPQCPCGDALAPIPPPVAYTLPVPAAIGPTEILPAPPVTPGQAPAPTPLASPPWRTTAPR